MKRMIIVVAVGFVLAMAGSADASSPATVVGKTSGSGKLVHVSAVSVKKPYFLWAETEGNDKKLYADYAVWCYRGAGETLLKEGSISISVSRWSRLTLPLVGSGICDVDLWVLNPSGDKITVTLLARFLRKAI